MSPARHSPLPGLLAAYLAVSSAAALPARSSVLDHDAVVGFAETVPATAEGTLMLKFKPYLKVFNGCVPFPAVDSEGNTSYVGNKNTWSLDPLPPFYSLPPRSC